MLATKNGPREAAGVRPWAGLILFICGWLVGCTPPGPQALLDGRRLLDAGKPAEAVPVLQRAVEIIGTNAHAWNYLGLAHHLAGQPAGAFRAYHKAVQLDPNLAEARFNLGCLESEQNMLPEAISTLTTFTLLQPQDVHGWERLGALQLRARQFDAAERSLQQAVRLNSRLAETLNNLGILAVQRRKPVDAAAWFEAALRQEPGHAPATLNLAITSHQHLGRKAAALEHYKQFVALQPGAPAANQVGILVAALDAELNPPPKPAPPVLAGASNLVATLSNRIATATPPTVQTSTPALTKPSGASTPTAPPPGAQPAQPRPTDSATVAGTPPLPVPPSATPAPDSKPAAGASGTGASRPAELATAKPPVQPPPAQVVRVVEEEPVAVAKSNAATATPPAPPATTPAQPSTTTPGANPPAAVAATPARDDSAASGPETRPGFVDRINPRNWFRAREKQPTPLPGPSPRPSATPVVVSNPPPVAMAKQTVAPPVPPPTAADSAVRPPAETTPLPARPVGTPYAYRNPSPKPAGDAEAAQKSLASGMRAYQARRWSEAVEAYRRAATADPASFEAHYNLGIASFELGNLPLALTAYEEALALEPSSLNARYNFALALARANHPQDAARELESVLRVHPTETRAHLSLATVYAQQLSRKDKAREHYQRVLALEPQHPQAATIRYWLVANP